MTYFLKSRTAFSFILFVLMAQILFGNDTHNHPHNNTPPFIANLGQWEGPFQYMAYFGDLTVFAENNGFSFILSEPIAHHHNDDGHDHAGSHLPDIGNKHAFRLRLVNANTIEFGGEGKRKAYHNYFLGNDHSKWKGKVPLFDGLYAEDVYEGIDMKVHSASLSFKYDFVVHPGSDPDVIKFNYSGADDISFDGERILIKTSLGELNESIPMSYQIINGEQVLVSCKYKMTEAGFGFTFPEGYNTAYPLVIDPVLVAATLSGSVGASNFGHGATFDLAGNIYTHAISFGVGYPTTEGAFQEDYSGGFGTDAAISKLNPTGTELIYATYIGGSGGEYPHSTIVNGNEEIYVFGTTNSTNFPVSTTGLQQDNGGDTDIFITGLSADGSDLVGSTYLGGNNVDGSNQVSGGYDAFRGEINMNLSGEIYIASCSNSDNFPVSSDAFQPIKNNGQDAVVMKLNPNLSEILWSTFIGSTGGDMAYGLRIRDDQTVVVAGYAGALDGFPIVPGAYQGNFAGGINDGFICQLSADGTEMMHSTFIGLQGDDEAMFIDLDSQGDVWIYMQSTSSWTISPDVWGTAQGNVLVHKFNNDLSELLLTSYLSTENGSSGEPVAFMVDLCNGIYISAFSVNGNFIASSDALFDAGGFYLGVFEPDMTDLVYGTYYTENHVDGGTSRFDKQGIVYQGVCSGGGFSTTPDAWAPNQSTGWDIGVFKIDFEMEGVNAVAGAAGYLTGCAPHNVVFQNFSSGVSYLWDFGDGNTSDEFLPTHLYPLPGEYTVMLVVTDPESCNITDTAYIPITVFPEVEFYTDFSYSFDCETGTVEITDASAGPEDIVYEWDMGDGTILGEVNPVHTYDQPGNYTISLTLSSNACNQEMVEEQELVYIPYVDAAFNPVVIDICEEFTVSIINQSQNGGLYIWDMGDGNTVDNDASFEYVYAQSGTYVIEMITSNPATCNLADTIQHTIEIVDPPVLSPEITITQTGICSDLTFLASVNPNGPASTYTWTINGEVAGTEQTLESSVNSGALYEIQVDVTDAVCEFVFSDIVNYNLYSELGFELPPTLTFCYYQDETFLNATVPFADALYDWNSGLSSDPVLTVTEKGTYTVDVFYNGCVETQETNVNYGPEFALAFDAIICAGQPNFIAFDFPFIDNVYWDNGQTGFVVEISEGGYHAFRAVDVFGCDQIDSLHAIPRPEDPNLQIPNIFTPNGDGKNDIFRIEGDSLSSFNLQLYNRWGSKLFETQEIYGTWDGRIENGNEIGDDVIMYVVKYRDLCDLKDRVSTGNISILR